MINNGDQVLLGREDEQAQLARYVRDGKSVIVYGLAGIGKSALVQAVYRALGNEFERCTVDCDRENTTDRMVAALADALSILGDDIDTADPVRVRDAVLARLKALTQPTLIVLDNFETLWEEESGRVSALLDQLVGSSRLALVIAVRASKPPSFFASRWKQVVLTGLEAGAAGELFSRRARHLRDGDDLADLVNRLLAGVPLAIELVARAAEDNQAMTLNQLREDVDRILLSMPMNPGGDRGSSLEASLEISVRRLDDRGKRLLALLGVLPAGIAAADLANLADRITGLDDIQQQAGRLAELGLAYVDPNDPERRLRTLKPIRDYSGYRRWPPPGDLDAARAYYLDLVGRGTSSPAAENPNFTSMAETLPDRVRQCEALIRQGTAELDASDNADARETFRAAAAIARRAREPRLLASAALGISGGLNGPGHTLDRADEERLALLREAEAVLDDGDPLKFRVLIRLLRELHFDASVQARSEMKRLRERASNLEERAGEEDRLQFDLLELSAADPAQDLAARAEQAEEAIRTAQALGDVKTEIKARHLLVSFLLEDGRNDAAETERKAASARIHNLPRQGDRDASAWQDGVMRRARLLFIGKFDEVRRELGAERPEGDPADSPYRRWLHQNVLLTLDTGTGAPPQAEDELSQKITEVDQLVTHLKRAEAQKFALPEDKLTRLAYEWWPTWRATQVLLRAMRGSPADQQAAYEGIRGLSTRPDSGLLFGRILRHEYYVQVLGLITLAVQRLGVLSGTNAAAAASQDQWHDWRTAWAADLDRLLGEFQGRVVVPGSGVMNLGSVQTYRAMAKACAESWSEVDRAFDEARDHNQQLGGKPALVRTLVADAEMHRILGSDQAMRRAEAVAQEAAELSETLGMQPWRHRAEAVLEGRREV
jgi:hypothetical protein